MCRIHGQFNADVSPAELRRVAATQRHGGPDGTGHARGERWALGSNRLAVMDPAGGTQPYTVLDGAITVVFNGELYNHDELRRDLSARGYTFTDRCDGSVLPALHHLYGDSFTEHDRSNVDLLATAVGLLPADTADLLDVGSGTGRLTRCAGRRYRTPGSSAWDPAPSMVAQATEKFAADRHSTFTAGVVEDLSQFVDGSFDVVISSFALHHLELDTYKLAAAELFRVLRPGGRFVNADQFCRVMGPAGSPERAADVLDLLTAKARYYLENASFERMLLQVDLLPRFMREDGEILTTPEFWTSTLDEAGFSRTEVIATPPVELCNRVVVAYR
jgi:ubiquinone/menaquinone biosynthesis C-methylase UbiE